MCDECGVPYNTKSTLRQHKMAVHPLTNNGQTYPCLHSGTGCRVFKLDKIRQIFGQKSNYFILRIRTRSEELSKIGHHFRK